MWKWIKSTKGSSDQDYDALMELLIQDREKQEEKFRCYHLRVKAVSAEFRVAGDKLGDLLRSRAEPCLIHPDDQSRTPWIDFLAAGVGNSDQPPNWLAFVTSDSRIALDTMGDPGGGSIIELKLADPERIKIVHKVFEKLPAFFTSGVIRESGVTSGDNPIDLSEMRDRFMNHSADRTAKADDIAPVPEAVTDSPTDPPADPDPNPCILIFGVNSEEASVRAMFGANCNFIFRHVATLDELKCTLFEKWQAAFGPGWLGSVDRFHRVLTNSASRKSITRFIECEAEEDSGSRGALAAIATAKLVNFGWLPGHLNERSAMLGESTDGIVRKSFLKKLYEEDIRFFRLPRVKLPHEEKLHIRNSQDLSEAMWLNFKSPHPVDKVILAIEITAYGRRGQSPRAAKRKSVYKPRFRLSTLSLTAFGVIRSFFPFVRHDVIGYTAGSSTTTRSGMLDSLVRKRLLDPLDSRLKEKLEREICNICYPSMVSYKFSTSLEETREPGLGKTSAERQGPEDSVSNKDVSEVTAVIESLMSVGESGTAGKNVLSPLIRSVGKLLRLEKHEVDSALQYVPDSPRTQRLQVEMLKTAIARKGSPSKNIKLTRESDFPRLKLLKSLSEFMIGAKFYRLRMPDFVQNWVGALARFVWIVPLDRMTPSPAALVRSGPTALVGSRAASRYFPNLFSEVPEDGAVEVKLDLLLNLLAHPSECDAKNRWRGWLANRISETNELMVGLTFSAGYLPDFQLHSFIADFQRRKGSLDVILEQLDSRLIVRCIMDMGGAPLLEDWSNLIPKQIRALIATGQSHADYINPNERLDSLFKIFDDATGMAVAALDCCRRRNERTKRADPISEADRYTVYFLPGKLREYFYSQDFLQGDNHRELHDNVGEGPKEDTFKNLEEGLGRSLLGTPFEFEKTLELIQRWQNSEGNEYGETAYDLLMSVKDQLYPNDTPPIDFLRNCKSLLSILQPEVLH
ncbi:MAG: hypothetical protein H7Y36_00410 [Armatimonadetes bacterium]|nr:hypothetical protein [Akkermansiaceae bacterium]